MVRKSGRKVAWPVGWAAIACEAAAGVASYIENNKPPEAEDIRWPMAFFALGAFLSVVGLILAFAIPPRGRDVGPALIAVLFAAAGLWGIMAVNAMNHGNGAAAAPYSSWGSGQRS